MTAAPQSSQPVHSDLRRGVARRNLAAVWPCPQVTEAMRHG